MDSEKKVEPNVSIANEINQAVFVKHKNLPLIDKVIPLANALSTIINEEYDKVDDMDKFYIDSIMQSTILVWLKKRLQYE